jgi:transcriptional regulator with XRE-family HTH domain
MASKGWTADAIARAYRQLSPADVRSILGTSIAGGRNPRAKLSDDDAALIRDLHDDGVSRQELADRFNVSRAAIDNIICRRSFRDVPRRRRSRPVRAARPRPTSPSGEWWLGPAWRDDDDPYFVLLWNRLLARIEAHLPAPAPPRPLPMPAGEQWGPAVDVRPRGGQATAAKLSDDDASLIRELRAAGMARKDLAGLFGVSVATITRITRGDTYPEQPRPVLDQVVTPELPAIAVADRPRATWSQPTRRPRSPAGEAFLGDAWRDDGPALPPREPDPPAPPATSPIIISAPTVWTEPESPGRDWLDD